MEHSKVSSYWPALAGTTWKKKKFGTIAAFSLSLFFLHAGSTRSGVSLYCTCMCHKFPYPSLLFPLGKATPVALLLLLLSMEALNFKNRRRRVCGREEEEGEAEVVVKEEVAE